MRILITGAGGFVGQLLAKKLLGDDPTHQLVLCDKEEPPNPAKDSPNVETVAIDLVSRLDSSILSRGSLDVVFILHGIMSSIAEANLELGMSVNFDSVRQLLDFVKKQRTGTKVIFTSSCAVYGRGAVIKQASETDVVPIPETSYGTQKLMIECLINDYSRRGEIDGRILRLPTVFVRAGTPTGAASSFVSGIVREPVHGLPAVLPVDPEIGIWLTSPRTLAENLIHAMKVPAEDFGHFRQVLLPGCTASGKDILDTLEKVVGKKARDLVAEHKDETIQRIVLSWPSGYDITRALELGFKADVGLEQTIRDFVEGEKKEP